MKITRRKFIAAAPVVAGAVLGMRGVALGKEKTGNRDGLFPLPEAALADPLAEMTWASFYPFQGTEFTFSGIGSNASLALETMVDTKRHNLERINQKRGENFILKFTDTARSPLKEGTYDVNHFRLGDFRLFITQGGKISRKNYYIAVINRIVS